MDVSDAKQSPVQLATLQGNLTSLPTNKSVLNPALPMDQLTLANPATRTFRIAEMLGQPSSFRIAEFMQGHNSRNSVLAADTLAGLLHSSGVSFEKTGTQRKVSIPTDKKGESIEVIYDEQGIVLSVSAKDREQYLGRDILHYLTCFVAQDVALVLKKGDEKTAEELVYAFDASMYEKTPKDPMTGVNAYLGRNFFEFHGQAKTFGGMLSGILPKLWQNFAQGKLDSLVIDLRGNNSYQDEKETETVARFERDHIVPIIDESGVCHGFLGYASVYWQKPDEVRSPYQGGEFLNISAPAFHQTFKLAPKVQPQAEPEQQTQQGPALTQS